MKNLNLSKKAKLILLIIGVLILGLIIWLLVREKTSLYGTWILKERVALAGQGEPAVFDGKIVMSDNKNGILYVNDVEECQITVNDKKMVCTYSSGTDERTFEIIKLTKYELHLTDNNYTYHYELDTEATMVLKNGFNIHFRNWKLNMDGKDNSMKYPSVKEIEKQYDDFIKKDGSNINLNVSLDFTLNKPGDYVKYTFEIVNDGTVDAMINSTSYKAKTDVEIDLDAINVDVDCYQDREYNFRVMDEPVSFKSGKILYCQFNLDNNSLDKQVKTTITKNWIVKQAS